MNDRPYAVSQLYYPQHCDVIEIDAHLSMLEQGILTLPYDALVPLSLLCFADAESEVFSAEEAAVIIESMQNCFEWTMHPLKGLVSCALIKEGIYTGQIPQQVFHTLNWIKEFKHAS